MILDKEPENFKKKFDVVSCFLNHDGKFLLLHRQDHKPQGNTWGMPAGKVDEGEDLAQALIREVNEEISLTIDPNKLKFHKSYIVRYPDFDFIYHVFYSDFEEIPELILNEEEHKGLMWVEPSESLKLDLIPDEDYCIKDFFGV